LIEGPEGLLLVRNVRRGGRVDWSPPGGVIDEGETLLAGLTREVEEETGIHVEEWAGPLYEVAAEAPQMGWRLRVEVHRAVRFRGSVGVIDDPDGIVDQARYFPSDSWAEPLADQYLWVREPLLDWLAERWVESRRFAYRVVGAEPGTARVTRI
jgi:8-oxo-dGTP diphosphatase